MMLEGQPQQAIDHLSEGAMLSSCVPMNWPTAVSEHASGPADDMGDTGDDAGVSASAVHRSPFRRCRCTHLRLSPAQAPQGGAAIISH